MRDRHLEGWLRVGGRSLQRSIQEESWASLIYIFPPYFFYLSSESCSLGVQPPLVALQVSVHECGSVDTYRTPRLPVAVALPEFVVLRGCASTANHAFNFHLSLIKSLIGRRPSGKRYLHALDTSCEWLSLFYSVSQTWS